MSLSGSSTAADERVIEETLHRLQEENFRLKEELELKNAALETNREAINKLGADLSARLDQVKITGDPDKSTVTPPSAGDIARTLLEGKHTLMSDMSFEDDEDEEDDDNNNEDHVLDADEEEDFTDHDAAASAASAASSSAADGGALPAADGASAASAAADINNEPGIQSINVSSFFQNTEILAGLVEKFQRGFHPEDVQDQDVAGSAGVFTGQSAVDWLVKTILITRKRAVAVCQYMLMQKIIEAIDKSGKSRNPLAKFRDDRSLFRYMNEDTDFEFLQIKQEHEFLHKDINRPIVCDVCKKRIWTGGLSKCKNCKIRCHKHCEALVTTICSKSETGTARLLPNGAVSSYDDDVSGTSGGGGNNNDDDDTGVPEEREVDPVIVSPLFVKLSPEYESAVASGSALAPNVAKYQFSLPSDCSPVIVFVNRKSGGQEGGRLLGLLSQKLHECQIWDLSQGGPRPGLLQFKSIPGVKILVCGGDGTVGWVLSEMDKVDYGNFQPPPVAILPMGTGNDLSRVLGWGPGGGARTMNYLMKKLFQIVHADSVLLDRWSVTIHELDRQKNLLVMNNYLSLGVDAKIALKFHQAREESPEKFKSKNLNKFWYVTYAAKAMLSHSASLSEKVAIEVDGQPVPITKDLEAVIVLNIPSYAAGTDLWGKKSHDAFLDQSFSDNLIEVVGITGVSHMGRIQAKLSSGRRLAQGKHLRFTVKSEVAAQIDGEPWLQKPGVIDIRLLNQARMLRFDKKERFHPDFVTVNLTPQELDVIAADFIQGVPTYKKKVHHVGRKYSVFIGTEAVDWLMYYMKTDDRSKAWKVGQLLMDLGVFGHVGNHKHFRDQNIYYKFSEGKGPLHVAPVESVEAAAATLDSESKSWSASDSVSAKGLTSSTASTAGTAGILAALASSSAAAAAGAEKAPVSQDSASSLVTALIESLTSPEVVSLLHEALRTAPQTERAKIATLLNVADAGASVASLPAPSPHPESLERERRSSLAQVVETNVELRSKIQEIYTTRAQMSVAAARVAGGGEPSSLAVIEDSPQPENFLAHLKVYVVEAKDLRPKNSSCDPYLVCDCELETFKSHVMRRTGDPVFGEEFHFVISRSNAMLNFALYDHNMSAKMMSLDEAFLGRLRIPVSSLEYGVVDKWYRLLPKKDKNVGLRPKGSLHLIIEYTSLLGSIDSGMSLGPEPFIPPGEPTGGFKSVMARVSEANHSCCAFNNVYYPLAENEEQQTHLRLAVKENDDDITPEFEMVSSVAIAEGLFEYFNAPMKFEDVDVYVQRDERVISNEWTLIGTYRTDANGRVFVPMPKWVHSTVGHYRVRMIALHDHSVASGSLFIVHKSTGCVVYDIDGTLTIGDQEVVQQAVKDAVNVSYDLKLRKGALSLVRLWFSKGYLPVYLSGRAGSFYNLTREWLTRHGFPPGLILHTRSHLPTLPVYASVGVFKRDWVSHLRAIGLDVFAAYGNTETDIRAYFEVGIPKERTFIVGPHAGHGNTVNCGRSNYKDHLVDVASFPEAAVPIPRESLDW